MTTTPVPQEDPVRVIGGREFIAHDYLGMTLLRAQNDAWYEFCSGDDHQQCVRCGGSGINRIAGSEFRMKEIIRKRNRFENSPMTMSKKAELKHREAIDEWTARNPYLAYLLAVVRADGDRAANGTALLSMALRSLEAPFSGAQERYTVSLLLDRALECAFDTPERIHVGNVGAVATFTGRVTYVATLPQRYGEATPNVLVIVETNVGRRTAALKINTRAAWAQRCVAGQEITVEGTVTSHDEHRHYGRQTVLTNVQQVW